MAFACIGVLVCALPASAANAVPAFTGAGGTYFVTGGSVAGTPFGEVRATDADAGSTITYGLVSAPAGVAVNASTGRLSTTRTITSADGPRLAVTVSATDGTDTTQSTFTVQVVSASTAARGVRRELYNGAGGSAIGNLTGSDKFKNGSPDATTILSQFNWDERSRPYDFFGTRFTSWVVPSVSGAYRFALAAHSTTELRLAPLGSASTILSTAPIARTTGNEPYEWLGGPAQISEPVQLVAGQLYLLEALKVKEYWGEWLAVGWQPPRALAPQPGSSASLIPNRNLYVPSAFVQTGPSAPQQFVVDSIAAGNVTLSWSPSGMETATGTYVVTRDGARIGEVVGSSATPTFTDTGVTGTHTYGVTAIDGAGNASAEVTIAGVDAGATVNALEAAVGNGDARLLPGPNAAIDAALAAANQAKLERYALLNSLWGGLPSIEYSTNQFNNLFAVDATARDRVFPILEASKRGYGGNITACPAAGDCGRAMAAAGTTTGGARFGVFGLTPFPNSGTENGGTTNWRVDLGTGLDRLLSWLITGTASTSPATSWRIAIVTDTANAAAISTYLTARGIGSGGTITACTMATIATCMQNRDLVIVGSKLLGTGTSVAADAIATDSAMGAALQAGTPVLFAREADANASLEALALSRFGLSRNGWTQGWWGRADYLTTAAITSWLQTVQSDTTYDGIVKVLDHLRADDWDVNMSGCATTTCATNPTATAYLNTEFYPGARTYMKNALDTAQSNGMELFAQPQTAQNRLLRLLVLLGDVYRRDVRFPLEATRGPRQKLWYRAYFADHAQYNLRAYSQKMVSFGTFSKPIRDDVPRVTTTISTDTRPGSEFVTSTGLYAIPGRAFTIRRTDAGTGTITMSVNFQRPGSTQEMDSYARPKYLQQAWLRLEPGRTYTYTTGVGGPIYLNVASTAAVEATTIQFTDVGEHPFWDGSASGRGSTARFAQLIDEHDYDWVDFVTPGYEVHSRYSYFLETLGASRWPGPDNLATVTQRYFYQSIYNLAGYTGRDLSMSSTIGALCAGLGWTAANGMACDQGSFRIGAKTHFNSDQATCGFGCSGNPYDAWWAFSVLGWGDSHEVGHNVGSLGLYGGESTEVVPNVFASHTFYEWNRENPAKAENIGHPLEQEAMYRSLNEAQRAADPVQYARSLIWGSGQATDPAARVGNNGLFRLMIYLQIAQQSHHRTDVTFGDGGWDAYTMMRHWERLNYQAHGSDAAFSANKARLGLTAYVRADAISDNDLFLLAASWVTRLDQRPVLDMFGVTYSAKAAAQVGAWSYPAAPRAFYYWPTRVDGSAFWATESVGSRPVDGRTGGLPSQPFHLLYTAPDADGVRSPYAVGKATTFKYAQPIRLLANVGGPGRVTFNENGAPIPGCVDVTLGARTYRSWLSGQSELEATCDWTPATLGATTITSTYTPASSGFVASSAAPLHLDIIANPTAPIIGGLSRTLVREGERVVITGSGLQHVSRITFAGERAGFSLVSSTQLRVTVPQVASGISQAPLILEATDGWRVQSPSITVRRLVASVAIDRRSIVTNPGRVIPLGVVTTPVGVTQPEVVWSSSDPGVATVSATGSLQTIGIGAATITATTVDGLLTATAAVTVVGTPIRPLTALSIANAAIEVGVGLSTSVPSVTRTPADATNSSISWRSLHPDVATVGADGTITGISHGTATLRATADDGGATADVTVTVNLPVTANDAANTVTGLTTDMQVSFQGGRTPVWVTYTTAAALPDLTGNSVLLVRRVGTTTPVNRLVFTDGSGTTSPKLVYSPAVTYLSDLGCKAGATCSTGWSSLGWDRSNDGGTPLRLRRSGTTFDSYAKGIGVHAGSTLTFDLAGRYGRFRADVGPDKRAVDVTSGTVTFIVRGDGVELYRSPAETTKDTAAAAIDINVTGVQTLELVVDGGSGNSNDLADWAGAHVLAPITGVALDATGKSVAVGANVGFTPTVSAPSPGTTTTVTWTTSNAAVATVSAAGVVTGIAPGAVMITAASTASPTVTASARVVVTAPSVWSIVLNKRATALAQGASETLVATVQADAGAPSPTWSSSNTAVATVSSSGVVTGVAAGTAVISLATPDGAARASATVTVGSGVVAVTGVSINPGSLSVTVGSTGSLAATIAPAGATNQTVAWHSSSALIATVSSAGVVTGVRPGTATVSVRTASGGFTARVAVTVTQAAVAVTGVSLDRATLALVVNGTGDLVATVAPTTATNTLVRWSSSNTAVAAVSATGRVTAVGGGRATVRVTTLDGARTATVVVTVAAAKQTPAISTTASAWSKVTAAKSIGKTPAATCSKPVKRRAVACRPIARR